MKHTGELALLYAQRSSESLARWISCRQWGDLAETVLHLAYALEHCWKIQAGVREGDRYVGYPEAAVRCGWATRAWGRYKFKYDHLETIWLARNEQHDVFNEERAHLEEHTLLGFGSLFLEIERATDKRLEDMVPYEWRTILAVPYVRQIVEWFIQNCLAPLRSQWVYVYLRCPACGYETFDSMYGQCRICFYQERTFFCAHHGKASLLRDQKHWLPTPDSQQTKEVCGACFETLARQRVVDLVFGEPRVDLTKQFSRITKCPSPTCQRQCFDLRTARCLLCGVEDELWSSQELDRLGLKLCQECQNLFEAGRWRDAYCQECLAGRRQCLSCDVLRYPEDGITMPSRRFYCDECAKYNIIQCNSCHTYMEYDPFSLDDTPYCKNCIPELSRCSGCGEWCHPSKGIIEAVPGKIYCRSCVRVRECAYCVKDFYVYAGKSGKFANERYCEECTSRLFKAEHMADYLVSRSDRGTRVRRRQVRFLVREFTGVDLDDGEFSIY